ncbi:MAG: hypothetical protein Q8942_18230 [Bacillota bacterium]|nr:hypothetical protein [Bacillota bacterium]
MKVFKGAVRSILDRPFIWVYFGIIALIYSIIDSINPLTALLMGFNRIGKGDFLEMIIYSIQIFINIMTNAGTATKALIVFIILLLVVSLLMGVAFSGYFNVINNVVRKKDKYEGEFFEGLKSYFLRTTFVSLRALLTSIFVIFTALIAAVPAVIITKSWISGRQELTIVAAFVDVITVGALILIFMFFSTYISFWFPASINNDKSAFLVGKENADKIFWKLSLRYILFFFIFLICHFILSRLSINPEEIDLAGNIKRFAVFVANWFFNTVFFSFAITYVFSAYKLSETYVEEDMDDDYTEEQYKELN